MTMAVDYDDDYGNKAGSFDLKCLSVCLQTLKR